ncbi:MAG: hypothetical protein IJ217_02710 [Clostridia bacterium]|nr:hypothetical protein [Clostridia bacterium]
MKNSTVLVIGIVIVLVVAGTAFAMNGNKRQVNRANVEELVSIAVPDEKEGANVRKMDKFLPSIDETNILEIKENYFIESTNDVYLNLDDYLGRSVKIQGYVYTYRDNNGDICYAVVRNTPGCCGNDGLAGLDIRYAGEYPEEGDWIEVVGIIGKDNIFNSDKPAIYVYHMEETEVGNIFVNR